MKVLALALCGCSPIAPSTDAPRTLQAAQAQSASAAANSAAHTYSNRHGPAVNPDGFWRWQWERTRAGLPKPPDAVPANVTPQVEAIQARRGGAALTWIGHASMLVQLDGLNILNARVRHQLS